MSTLGEQLGMGGPAEQERIVHDLRILRRDGIDALRRLLGGRPVSQDLYLAVLIRLAHRADGRQGARRAWEDHERGEAADEARQTRRGGNR